MNKLTRYKLEFSFAPVAVIAIALIAAVTLLGDLFWKAVVMMLAAAAIWPAAEALWSVWTAGGDDDGDDDDMPAHGAPTGAEPYAPVH